MFIWIIKVYSSDEPELANTSHDGRIGPSLDLLRLLLRLLDQLKDLT